LHAVIDRPVESEGYSANYSGSGFSYMRFKFIGTDEDAFARWIDAAGSSGNALDLDAYRELLEPSERVPVMRVSSVDPDLFRRTVERCIEPGTACMSELMQHSHASARDAAEAGGEPVP